MFLEELQDLPRRYPSLKDCGFFVAGINPIVDNLIFPLVFAGIKISPFKRHTWLTGLLKWGLAFSRPPYIIELVAVSSGSLGNNGIPHQATARICHSDGYFVTAVPVVAAIMQYLDGSIRRPGIWLQANCVDENRIAEDMAIMGLPVSVTLEAN